VRGDEVVKKIFVVLIVAMILMSFTGCRARHARENSTKKEQTKVVHIDSEPQGATVFIDNMAPVTTLADVKLSVGWHYIKFRKDGYLDVVMKGAEVKKDTSKIFATLDPSLLNEKEFATMGPISFDTVPHFACCSAAAISYSNIFYGGTYTVSGETMLNSFDIIFPSGKKVHFNTEKTSSKVNKFSKVVTFNELGGYKIVSNGENIISFEVDYKPTILPPTPKMEDLFPNIEYKNAIAVPVGREVNAKVLITDANGTPIPNTALGVYGLKTDKDGIVNFKAKVVRTECPYCYQIFVNGRKANVKIYSNLLVFGYDFAKYTKKGKLVECSTKNANIKIQPSLLPPFKNNTKIIFEGNHIYMPYGTFGAKINEIYKGAGTGGSIITPSQKNPSVIYTSTFVSKDGGNTFEKMEMRLNTIAINPNNPGTIVGAVPTHSILKSTDYGMHFREISVFGTDKYINQIVIDPKDTDKIYFAASNGLYVTNDGGKSFSPVLYDFGTAYSIAIDPNNSDVILVGCKKGIVKSNDGGKTWNVTKGIVANDNAIECIVFDPENPDIIYAGTVYNGIFVSSDCGNTWRMLHKFGIEIPQSIAVNPLKHNVVYVASFRDGIYKSVNYGKTFTKLDFSVGSETSIATGSNGKLYAIDDGVPFVLNSSGKFVPLDGKRFLIGGPDWKIIDDELFIDVNGIKTDFITCKTEKDYIEFYKACDMIP
jgi:hypothetical protein